MELEITLREPSEKSNRSHSEEFLDDFCSIRVKQGFVPCKNELDEKRRKPPLCGWCEFELGSQSI